jgi:hypothetical protein
MTSIDVQPSVISIGPTLTVASSSLTVMSYSRLSFPAPFVGCAKYGRFGGVQQTLRPVFLALVGEDDSPVDNDFARLRLWLHQPNQLVFTETN